MDESVPWKLNIENMRYRTKNTVAEKLKLKRCYEVVYLENL